MMDTLGLKPPSPRLPSARHAGARFEPCDLHLLKPQVIASRQLPYIYLNNFKCACSTIRGSLWSAEHALGYTTIPPGDPHQLTLSPFTDDLSRFERKQGDFVFTFVRNPFTRVLSAYLDKIVRREAGVVGPLLRRHGLDRPPASFAAFLELVAEEAPEEMDLHWRPQTLAVGYGVVPFDFIGSFETLNEDLPFVMQRIFGREVALQAHRGHRTDAQNLIERHFGPRQIELVQHLYAADFVNFGYDPSPSRLERTPPALPSPAAALRAWLQLPRQLAAGELAAATSSLEQAHAAFPNERVALKLVECWLELARQLKRRGRGEEAGHRLQQALTLLRQLKPHDPAGEVAERFAESYTEAAKSLEEDGRFEAAVHCLRQALTAAPSRPTIWKRYGRVLIRNGRYRDGLQARLQAVRLRYRPSWQGRHGRP